jgi:hypothetical protein
LMRRKLSSTSNLRESMQSFYLKTGRRLNLDRYDAGIQTFDTANVRISKAVIEFTSIHLRNHIGVLQRSFRDNPWECHKKVEFAARGACYHDEGIDSIPLTCHNARAQFLRFSSMDRCLPTLTLISLTLASRPKHLGLLTRKVSTARWVAIFAPG